LGIPGGGILLPLITLTGVKSMFFIGIIEVFFICNGINLRGI